MLPISATSRWSAIKESGSLLWIHALLISSLLLYLIFSMFFKSPACPVPELFPSSIQVHQPKIKSTHNGDNSPTNLSHIVFGLVGSEQAWHYRKHYIESWWRSKSTRGYLFLDKKPKGGDILPWSKVSPPYKVSRNISKLMEETRAAAPVAMRIVHGIREAFREGSKKGGGKNMRWLVMGDDDSIFMVDNLVEVLSRYDHTKYYYLGGQSEFIMSNFWYSFNQGFGGAGFMLSYPLAKALSDDMENCIRRYAHLNAADLITMACIADVGVNLSPQKGIHQIDLRGNISGFLSSHPQAPLISLHHFDAVDPIFPKKSRSESARHLMKAAKIDQSRLLQQTICFQRAKKWSFSVAWGYSVHLYEKIMPRSWLQKPIETFSPWHENYGPPRYMFNTRRNPFVNDGGGDACEAPHVFYLDSVEKKSKGFILSVYSRDSPRGMPPCSSSNNGNFSANNISKIEVLSPTKKRPETGRCECCDVLLMDKETTARVQFRECMADEIIA